LNRRENREERKHEIRKRSGVPIARTMVKTAKKRPAREAGGGTDRVGRSYTEKEERTHEWGGGEE